MGLVAPGPLGFTGRAREESETREGFELPAIDVRDSREVFAHPCTGGGSGRVCGVQGTIVGTVPPWRTRETSVVGSGMMGGHARGGYSDLLAIASRCWPYIGTYRALSDICRKASGYPGLFRPTVLLQAAVRLVRYRPLDESRLQRGVPVVFSEVHSVRDTCRSH